MNKSVYLIEDFQKVSIIKDLGNHNFLVNTQSNLQIQVSKSQITNDKDLVIQTLLSNLKILKKDYTESRDAWWRLKDETLHYKKLLQKTNINSFKHY